MKKINYYFTLILVAFITLFSFFNMFQIVALSNNVIKIVINNLLPSLLPFMILISLCLLLGLLNFFSYIIQWFFKPLFKLSPIMSSIYLEIPLVIYICHLIPSIIKALCYRQHYSFLSLQEAIAKIKQPHLNFVDALKKSILSSCYAFIFILGYMLVFQFIGYAIGHFINDSFINAVILGVLEFSSGSLGLLQFEHTPLVYSLICFNLSFSGLSVMMQTDNLLDEIDYSFKKYFLARLYHGIFSFILCYLYLSI